MVYNPLYRAIPISLALQMVFFEVGVTLPPPEDIPEERPAVIDQEAMPHTPCAEHQTIE